MPLTRTVTSGEARAWTAQHFADAQVPVWPQRPCQHLFRRVLRVPTSRLACHLLSGIRCEPDAPAADLFHVIYGVIDSMPVGVFDFRWISIHLDATEKAAQRNTALAERVVVGGNVAADLLAALRYPMR